MNDQPSAAEAGQEMSLRAARAMIARELGPDQLAELHRPNRLLDVAAIAGSLVLFGVLAAALALGSAREPIWWVCLFLQGNLVLVMAFINHDVFVHRKFLPRRLRWVLSSLLVWPSQLRGAVYEEQHLTHHRALGTPNDAELYKQSIDTALRRFLYATPALMFYRAVFLRGRTSSVSVKGQAAPGSKDVERTRYEKATRLAMLAVALYSLFWDYRFLVYGYILPFVVVTPVLNTVRIILEHFDLDADNRFWVGTLYRTGLLTRIMFWWDAGDCHLVHHFYANIPFYRMGRALDLIRPILLREGVFEHRSLARLLAQWFSASRPHWSVPPQAGLSARVVEARAPR